MIDVLIKTGIIKRSWVIFCSAIVAQKNRMKCEQSAKSNEI